MFEYIEFYTKNLSNLTILLVIGAIIAILDITLRNVVKGVYLNVRENIRLRHGSLDEIEGMENNNPPPGGGGECPKDCKDVLELKNKLTELIQNAANLQKDIQTNDAVIKNQQNMIEIMKRNVDKIVKKGK